jgi:hypothetical protein
VGGAAVPRPHAGREAIDRVVGLLGDPVEIVVVERLRANHRAEDLLGDDLHVGLGVFEHGRRDEIAEITDPLAADRDLGARLAPILDVAGDAGELLVRHQRTHLGRRVEARPDLDFPGDVGDSGDDTIVDRFVSEEP